jgi:hypothetical protein
MLKHKLVDFIIQFMEEVDKEISEMKLFVRFIWPWLRLPLSFRLDTNRHSPAKCSGAIRGRVILDTSKLKIGTRPLHPSTTMRLTSRLQFD